MLIRMAGILRQSTTTDSTVVRLTRSQMSDVQIVQGLVEKEPRAAAALYDRYGNKVNRLVWRLLGADPEHDDVVHGIFVNILTSIEKLKKPESLSDWITGITINSVRREIRNRKYRRILHLVPEYPEGSGESLSGENQILTGRVFSILNKMNTDDHMIFVLRFIERYTLGEIASSCGYSLATAKRRALKSKSEFMKKAQRDPVLSSLIEGKYNVP